MGAPAVLFAAMVPATTAPRQRILIAARELFFSRGFQKVSTDDLVKAAAISKATLYRHFGGMDDLLRAVVDAEVDGFERGIPREVTTPSDFAAALEAFGSNLLQFLNQPEIIRFSQLMFEEARSSPDLASSFYSSAYGRTQEDLAELIQQALDQGWLPSSQPASELAELLLGMWEGFGFVRALLGLTDQPFPDPEAQSQRSVAVFLQGQQREAGAASRLGVR